MSELNEYSGKYFLDGNNMGSKEEALKWLATEFITYEKNRKKQDKGEKK